MKPTRPYQMRSRAEQTAQTRQRILQSTLELAFEQPIARVSLPEVAERANVSVQTVLRQFGSRDALLDATQEFAELEVLAERATQPGDVDHALRTIVDHYERRGDGVLLLLGQEGWEPRAASVTASGRRLHRNWVRRVFEPLLQSSGPERDALVDLLVVVTDVYTWKLLRRDRALSAEQTIARMKRMVEALLERS